MTLRHNTSAFRAESQRVAQALEPELVDRLQRLAGFAFDQVVRNTEDTGSVDTGAYRAEHVIEQDGRPVYEHPERPGPEARFPSQKRFGAGPLFGPHALSEVRSALSEVALSNLRLANRRFVADWLENGTVHIEPRRIYERASQATEDFAASLALEPPRQPALRRARP